MTGRFDHIQSFENMGFKVNHNQTQQKTRCHRGTDCGNPNAKNHRDPCVSINLNDGIWNCHKCGNSGTVAKYNDRSDHTPVRKQYQRPNLKGLKQLSETNDPIVDWFKGRGIPESVVRANKVVRERDWIVIPYVRDGKLINFKRRHISKKEFRQAGNAEPIMFNRDRCVDPDWLIVVEGEFDAMAIETAGFTNVTSPNQGAPKANDKSVDSKLECIDNTWEIFESKSRIVIAVDNDENGRRLERELIRRFGAERCQTLRWGDQKDANEYLLEHGVDALRDHVNKNCQDVPVSGIWTVDDAWDSMIDGFRNGKKRGETTHVPEIDELWTWRTGDLNLWTGYNNEGKTTLLNQLLLLRAKLDGERVGVFSPENYPPDEFFDDLIHTLVGKSTDKYFANVMSEMEYSAAARFVNQHFFIVNPDDTFDLKTLFDKFRFLVRRHGIRHVVFDPWNQIDHELKAGEREDLYISRVMTQFKRFAVDNDVSMNIVAHQNTPREVDGAGNYKPPNKYNMKGGGTFSDKADNVLAIWRPYFKTDKFNPLVRFISEKIKKQRLVGHMGETDLEFDRKTNRFFSNGTTPFDDIRLDHGKQNVMFDDHGNTIPDDDVAEFKTDDLPF